MHIAAIQIQLHIDRYSISIQNPPNVPVALLQALLVDPRHLVQQWPPRQLQCVGRLLITNLFSSTINQKLAVNDQCIDRPHRMIQSTVTPSSTSQHHYSSVCQCQSSSFSQTSEVCI
jgi:hypothetical protein